MFQIGSGLRTAGAQPAVRSLRPVFSVLIAALAAGSLAAAATPQTVFLSLQEVRPALESFRSILPDQLKTSETSLDAAWRGWARRANESIRARVAQGDEDSLVNLVLFGTSFTSRPRLTARQIESILASTSNQDAAGARLDEITQGRIDDLVAAAARPRGNERLVFAQRALAAGDLQTSGGQAQAKSTLLGALSRVLKDIDQFAHIIQQAQTNGPAAEFAARSQLYHARGLSSDTSLRPSFAIEETLKMLHQKGVLRAPVRRIAILGPGLDFADKLEGYDFYPQQTIQPFATVDSLIRTGYLTASDVSVTTLDLSARVNAHISSARDRARQGQAYTLQLPLDGDETFSEPFLQYWKVFGDRIGDAVTPLGAPTNAGILKSRAIAVKPALVTALTPLDANVIVQRLDLTDDERFDIVVATNVFVYYDEFQQALALQGLQRMLRPGGLLLSNNALPEVPGSQIHAIGSTSVVYSSRAGDGDTVVWYQRCGPC